MRGFFELVGYEFKKIFKRKGAAAALSISALIAVLSPAGLWTGICSAK